MQPLSTKPLEVKGQVNSRLPVSTSTTSFMQPMNWLGVCRESGWNPEKLERIWVMHKFSWNQLTSLCFEKYLLTHPLTQYTYMWCSVERTVMVHLSIIFPYKMQQFSDPVMLSLEHQWHIFGRYGGDAEGGEWLKRLVTSQSQPNDGSHLAKSITDYYAINWGEKKRGMGDRERGQCEWCKTKWQNGKN